MNLRKLLLISVLTFLGACSPILSISAADIDTDSASSQELSELTSTPTPIPEPNPNSIEALANREYGEGDLSVEYAWHSYDEFVRYYITYDSDDLTIHGFVNIPRGKGPFPVIIALHGYIPATEYETLDYSTRYADSIARKGYIVLHPNMRNFPPSDSARRRDSLTGYTIDVLNLLAHVRELAVEESIFENADFSRMGIWGHSLGGGVALRVLNLVDEIEAAVLYGAVSQRYTNSSSGFTVFDLESMDASFSIHHGVLDDTISVTWSERLCKQLEDVGIQPECFFYEDEPHTFYRQGDGDPLFIQRTVEFYERYLQE